MSSSRIKLCVIGTGNFADYAHGPVLKMLAARDPDLQLAATADLDRAKAEEFNRRYGFRRSFSDWRQMLEAEKPDGVVVLTPVAATAPLGSEVIAAGFPVLLEKPPGRSREEIMKLIGAARQTGSPVQTAFNRRYSPLLTQMLAVRADECREPIEYLRCDFFRNERLDDDFSTTAIHGIDAIRHLSGGSYCEVKLDYQELRREKPARNIFLNARFSNGVYGVISFCPSTGTSFERYTVTTRHWTLIAETVIPGAGSDAPGRIFVYRDNDLIRTENPLQHPFRDDPLYLAGYYSEHAAFIERLRQGFPDSNDLEMSLDAVEIADALRHGRHSWRKDENQA